MDFSIESLIGIALGIGLAAATGFRIFIPLLLVGLAARFDMLPLGDGFQWLATAPALLTLGTAAVLDHVHERYWHRADDRRPDVFNAGSATMRNKQGYWVIDFDGARLVEARTEVPGRRR